VRVRPEVWEPCNWAVAEPGNVYRVKKSRRHEKKPGVGSR
jgi:hypothetical protein